MFKPPAISAAVGGVSSTRRGEPASSGRKVRAEFTRALEKALDDKGIKMTNHARERILSRRIRIDEGDVTRISEAMNTLQGKGGKISLLFMSDTTFVTDVKNRTLITALDNYGEANRVFTQIDSAALIDKA